MPAALRVIEDAHEASVLLDDDRRGLLAQLREPDSAAGLARKAGMSRQVVNYHLKELEKAGLITLFEERRKGNCYERVMKRSADTYMIDPGVLGTLGANPTEMADKLSAAYLMAVAGRSIREVSALSRGAEAAGKKLPTATMETEIRFRNARERSQFVEEMVTCVANLAAKYHAAEAIGGRNFRFVTATYPVPKSAAGSSTASSTHKEKADAGEQEDATA